MYSERRRLFLRSVLLSQRRNLALGSVLVVPEVAPSTKESGERVNTFVFLCRLYVNFFSGSFFVGGTFDIIVWALARGHSCCCLLFEPRGRHPGLRLHTGITARRGADHEYGGCTPETVVGN